MSREHVDHREIVQFARDRVNLPRDNENEYRAQARRLRDRLERYVEEHPDFELKRLQLSGSVAKSTALRSLNDIDIAAYIEGADAPRDVVDLLAYLADRLRTAFPNFSPDQVTPQTYSVRVSFRGSGLDVDVVPILYFGQDDWRGQLVSQEDGSFLETSIPLHLEFARRRNEAHETHFRQVVRLLKYWAKQMKAERSDFRFKSFLVELLLSHLADNGQDLSDYPEALQSFFTYIATTGLREKIWFTDFSTRDEVPDFADPIQVVDPVNPENNVTRLYTRADAEAIRYAALEAGDAIDAALFSPTKGETVRYWKKVFGASFQA